MTSGATYQNSATEISANMIATDATRRLMTMKCPRCGMDQTRVTDSRPLNDGKGISRRRECLVCGYRFVTHELFIRESRKYSREW